MASQVLDKTGLAFSGGGVRSAAFCSGVLRRLLQKRVTIDYLSSVSGGGYTAASYMDWKYRHGKKDDPDWHHAYFENLRKYANPLCDCFNPVRGIVDGVLLLLVLLVLTVVLPLLKAFSYVIPITFIVDSIVGDILRNQFECRKENITGTVKRTCSPKSGLATSNIIWIIIVMFLVFLVVHLLAKRMHKRNAKNVLTYLYRISGFAFAMVFLPWVLEIFEEIIPEWADVLAVGVVFAVWIGFPSLRHKAFKTLIILVYAYFVKWVVFKTPIAGIKYEEVLHRALVWVSGVLLWLVPYLGIFEMYGGHLFEEWRLTRAFFWSKTKDPTCGADSINNKDLTFEDIKDMRPQYQSNVTVNNWFKSSDHSTKKDYEIFTFSPTVIERIDCQEDEVGFKSDSFIKPKDIPLSCAMTTSGSAIAYDDGTYQDAHADSRAIKVVLGFGMGRNLMSQYTKVWMPAVVTLLVQTVCAGVIIGAVLMYDGAKEGSTKKMWKIVTVVLLVSYFVIFALLSIIPINFGGEHKIKWFIRWCIINIYNVRLLRMLFDITDVTYPHTFPPPVLALSDGGHLENLGLLPLLKLRLSRIVVVNGGLLGPGANYATDLLNALQQARDKLRCSFRSADEHRRDVIEDIRDQFVEKEEGKQPRSYRFKVQYYQKEGTQNTYVGEGEVLFLMPRHPTKGLVSDVKNLTWSDFDGDVKNLEESDWGSKPVLEASEVDHLNGCCFECCHSKQFSRIPFPSLGRFPFHRTENQLFTSSQHTAYHREGYHACVESKAVEFLNSVGQSPEVVTEQPQGAAAHLIDEKKKKK